MLSEFIKFATFGITMEVCFTFAADLDLKDPSPKGHSYVCMIPIYGSIAFLKNPILCMVSGECLIIRGILYGILFLIFEYIFGLCLLKIIGKCPWHYDSKYNIHHLIRLDYFPLWICFGLILEYL